MLALRELQRRFADGLLSGVRDDLIPLIAGDKSYAAARFEIYRRNRDGATINALKLTYPVVAALVGETFFAQTALSFSRACPPKSALFALHGAGFAEYLESLPSVAMLPYLADVARLEWDVSQAAGQPDIFAAAFTLGDVAVSWAASLRLLPVNFPVAAIWAAVLGEDEDQLERIDLSAALATLAIWRKGQGAGVTALSPAAAAFLAAAQEGVGVEIALARTAARTADPIAVLTTEILQADFIQMTPLQSIQGATP